jgi:branched-chain amino acid transport system substrate-binding protein
VRVKRLIRIALVTALFLALASFAYAAGGEETAEEKVIKIGCAVSMSGRVSPEGNALKEGAEVWEKFVNDKGGIDVGGEKYRVEVIFYDDKSDSATGAKLTEKLITEDEVQFLLGPFSSGITFATSAIGEKYGVITVAPLANATNVYERGFKHIFSVLPPAPTLTQPIFDLVATFNPKPKSVAIVIANDLFPISCAEGAKERAESLGIDVVLYEKYPAESTDVTTLLTVVKDKNPDMLLNSGYTKDALMVVRQTKEVGFNPKILAFSVGVMLPEFIPSLGADAEYVYEGEWWLPTMEADGPVFGSTANYVKLFEEMHGKTPDYHASCGTAAGTLLQLAIERAGTLDTEAVRAEMLKLDVELASFPSIKFNQKGQNVSSEHPVVQVQNGEYVVVYPPQNEAVYPMPSWDAR